MNILQITNTVCTDTHQATGVNRVVTQLSRYWFNTHHDMCYLAYFRDEAEPSPLFKASLHITIPFNTKNFESFLQENRIEIIVFNYASNQMLEVLPIICKIARKHNVKVVYCFHFMPGYEGCSHGSIEEIRYSIVSRKAILDKLKKWMIAITKPLSTKFILKRFKRRYETAYLESDKLVVFTESYIDQYFHIIDGKDRSKFAVIPNPLSFNEFLPVDKVALKKKEIIMVGRMWESQKKVSIALKIWKMIEQDPKFQEWTFSLIGSGQDEEFYHWLAKRYQLKRVRFEGRQDPKPYYERAAIFISTAGYEGWPMVLMEAMPMGCCCLSFDSYVAIHDIIEDDYNGKIIPDNDIMEYVKCLTELMLDDEKRITIGINAIESSHRFSMEIIGDRWRELFVE